MPVAAALPYIGLALSAYGAYQSYAAGQEQKEAMQSSAAESRAQVAAQQRIADIKNARERANMARAARIAAGTITNQGYSKGVGSSSGVQGGLASIGTQVATNLGVFGAVEGNQQDILASQGRQGQYQAEAGESAADVITGNTIFSIGSKAMELGGGFKTIFDQVKK